MKKIAFVTGATSGIGEAIAKALAADHSVVICGRRKERLEKLANELRLNTEVFELSFDVSDSAAVNAAIESLPKEWQDIEVLINNAGNAHGRAPIHQGDLADWDAMIDSNLKGLLYVTRAISPRMVERKSGDIINIGSIAGKEVYPEGNVYCASKFGVDAATNGMRMDLNPYGIRVVGIHPGLVETEFSMVRFKGDEGKSESVYRGITPLYAKDIAETVKFVIDRPPHVTLADITIFPTAQASSTMVHRQS
ncbi:MAG: SDR family NAD(P)-dependent oxidoreductase [Reichenbachiella sp.]|uniref:SDR family NAD(P)-dependent oxidoreductase n=1 Tax=Reichenbachiella sp. TaxID=2184521 RepID=UPI0032662ADE